MNGLVSLQEIFADPLGIFIYKHSRETAQKRRSKAHMFSVLSLLTNYSTTQKHAGSILETCVLLHHMENNKNCTC